MGGDTYEKRRAGRVGGSGFGRTSEVSGCSTEEGMVVGIESDAGRMVMRDGRMVECSCQTEAGVHAWWDEDVWTDALEKVVMSVEPISMEKCGLDAC